MSSAQRELIGIQYLRAVAVLLVVLDHMEGMFAMPKYYGIHFAGGWLAAGTAGVDLFFVISGFIIFYVTSGFDAKRVSFGDFVLRRFTRIVPLLWFCVILHFSLRSVTRGSIEPGPYLRAFILWPLGDLMPSQVWTLRHEFIFYAASAFALISKSGRLVLAAFLLLPLVFSNFVPGFSLATEGSDLLSSIFNLRTNTGFLVGVLVGCLHQRFGSLPISEQASVGILCLSPVVLLLAGTVARQVGTVYPVLTALTLASISGAILMSVLGMKSGSIGFLSAWLSLMGAASYSIYLTHDAFISISAVISRLAGLNLIFAAGLGLVLIVTFGTVAHLLVEKPLNRLFKDLMLRFVRAMI